MLVLGWWLLPITLFHVVPLYFDAVSWRELFPTSNRPGVLRFIWMRWIRELISTLLPVAGVGGDFVGARLAQQRGVPGAQAAASMVVDITVGAATQVVFVVAGVVLFTAGARAHASAAMAWGLLIGVAVFTAAIGAFVRIQHNRMFGLLMAVAHRAGSQELALRVRQPRRSDRRRYRCDVSSPPRLVVLQPATACRMGNRRRRGLAHDACSRQAVERYRFVCPGKPQRWRPRRGVHDTWSVGRPRRRSGLVRGAARGAREPGLSGFSHQTGSRAGVRSAGARGLAMGGRASLALWAGGQGKFSAAMTVCYRGVAVAGDSMTAGRPSASRNCPRRV